MTTASMLYQTRKLSGIVSAGTLNWVGQIMTNGTASSEEVAAIVADSTRQSVSDVVYTNTKTGEAVRALLRNGRNVSLDWVSFIITLTGAFENIDDGFERGRNSLVVRAHSRPFLRDCLAGITPRNVTNGLKATIQSVVDSAAQSEGTITTTTVYVAGLNILVGDNPDEGVWLVSKDGAIAATPAITANDPVTMDLSFGELPPAGQYLLAVSSRNGMGDAYGVATGKRKVTVKAVEE